jgi:hypothetical protein
MGRPGGDAPSPRPAGYYASTAITVLVVTFLATGLEYFRM